MNPTLARAVPLLSLLAMTSAPALLFGADARWIGSWATSPMVQNATTFSEPPMLAEKTLRQVVHLSAGGDLLRVRLDNTFGDGPLEVRSVHVATSAGGGKIDPQTDKPATFNAQASVTLCSGALVWSDPLPITVPRGADIAVTIQFGAAPKVITGHSLSVATSYLADRGEPSATELEKAKTVNHWFVLDGVDVHEPVQSGNEPATIVAFGDSITDGYRSTLNGNRRWPDLLAQRCAGNPATADLGVVNEGISGNRLTENGTGPSALARFDRDALAQSHARWIVVLEGINDIGHDDPPRTGEKAEQIELADEQIVTRAHAHNIKVYGATILPFTGAKYFSAAKEKEREAVNDWIRNSGTFDAVIDLDAATRDPHDPTKMLPAYDSGDHLHPNNEGYRKMAETIDLQLFSR